MKIEILEFIEGAKRARGVTVIIDVFRAFSVACYAFDSGASRVIATGSAEEALRLKKTYSKAVLAGERDEKKIPGFDFGNSPTEIIRENLQGYVFIHTTTAGTRGLVCAEGASLVLAGSLVNAAATASYIKALNPELVSLVAMGYRSEITTWEDIICAELISERLKGREPDFKMRIDDLRESSGKRFFNPGNIEFSPPTDFFLCTMTDRFGFALKAERRFDRNIELTKTEI
jgi:2-phosphosulfolactate phosphatase